MRSLLFLVLLSLYSVCASDITNPALFTNITAIGQAILRPNKGSNVTGTVTFEQDGISNLVRINVTLQNLARTDLGYAFHIHQLGYLTNATDFGLSSSNGGHFNPYNVSHGCFPSATRHVGDIGPIWKNTSDTSTFDVIYTELFFLHGNESVIGRSVVLHSSNDPCAAGSSFGTFAAVGVIGRGNANSTAAIDNAVSDSRLFGRGATQAFASIFNSNPSLSGYDDVVLGSLSFSNAADPVTGAPLVHINGTVAIPGVNANETRGLHIHQYGDITTGLTVGGHFNPNNQPHGLPPSPTRHAGDLGNVTADANGVFVIDTIVGTELITVQEQINGILGRAIVFHQLADNGTTYGSRVAVGVIGLSYTDAPTVALPEPSTGTTLPPTIPPTGTGAESNTSSSTGGATIPPTGSGTTSAPTNATTTSPPTDASTTAPPTSPPTNASTTAPPTSPPTNASTTAPPTSPPTNASTTAPPTSAPTNATTTSPPTSATTSPPTSVPVVDFTNITAIAHVVLRANLSAGSAGGIITLEQDGNTGHVRVNVTLTGVARRAGGYALHVHTNGVFGGQGTHYNPLGVSHGCLGVTTTRHNGDIGTVWDNTTNSNTDTLTSELLNLGANNNTVYSIIGRSIVLHSLSDTCMSNSTFGYYLASGIIGRGNAGTPPNPAIDQASQSPFLYSAQAVATIFPVDTPPNAAAIPYGTVTLQNIWYNGVLRVRINGNVTIPGVTPGLHGFHIHDYGDLTNSQSVGPHFGAGFHALPPTVGRHAGDLGNIVADANGNFVIDIINSTELISIENVWNGVIGRAIVIHQNPDNGTEASFGSRIAFGVIGIGQNTGLPTTPPTYAPTATPFPSSSSSAGNVTSAPTIPPLPGSDGSTTPASTSQQYAKLFVFLANLKPDSSWDTNYVAAVEATWATRMSVATGVDASRINVDLEINNPYNTPYVLWSVAGTTFDGITKPTLPQVMIALKQQIVSANSGFSISTLGADNVQSPRSYMLSEAIPTITYYAAQTACQDGTYRPDCSVTSPTTQPSDPTFPPATSEAWTSTYKIYILVICVVLVGSVLIILLAYCGYRHHTKDGKFNADSTYVARETFDATEMDTFTPAAAATSSAAPSPTASGAQTPTAAASPAASPVASPAAVATSTPATSTTINIDDKKETEVVVVSVV